MADKRIIALAVGLREKNITIDTAEKASEVRPYIAGLIKGLDERRHTIGTDYVISYKERAPANFREAIETGLKEAEQNSEKPLIFAMSTTTLKAAMAASTKVPIVFPSISDPEADGVARGGNATGVSAKRTQTVGECLAGFKATVPSLTVVHVLRRRDYAPGVRAQRYLEPSGRAANVTLLPADVASLQEIEQKLRNMTQTGPEGAPQQGVLVSPNDLLFAAAERIIEICQERMLPTFFSVTDWVRKDPPSALAGYGIPQKECGRLAARHVHEIWENEGSVAQVAITDVEPAQFVWAISKNAAAALKIKLSFAVGHKAQII